MHFKMSSTICFNLDKSKILLPSNGLKYLPKGINWDQPVQSAQADLSLKLWPIKFLHAQKPFNINAIWPAVGIIDF